VKCTSVGASGEKGICHKVLKRNLSLVFEFGAVDLSVDGIGREVEICEPINLSMPFGGGVIG